MYKESLFWLGFFLFLFFAGSSIVPVFENLTQRERLLKPGSLSAPAVCGHSTVRSKHLSYHVKNSSVTGVAGTVAPGS